MKSSEFVLSPDGKPYHVRVDGDHLSDNVILMGDPGRVSLFEELFERVEYKSFNREIYILTGYYQGERYTAVSTGMGCDNIDIVMTELDVAANMNLVTGETNPAFRSLNLVRIGTSGSLQADIPCGSFVASRYAVGLDGLLNYYECPSSVFEDDLQQQFASHLLLDEKFAHPYAVAASEVLLSAVAHDLRQGITATAPGFYAPQGRFIKVAPAIKDLNERLASFAYRDTVLTNLEMETSGIYGMARMLGHKALTICLIIANRATGSFINDYEAMMKDEIVNIMLRLAQLPKDVSLKA